MARIKILPPDVVAKIAAGEVVERPASVVKELLENALDAGSRSVKVEVQGAGRKLIRVTDDGEGMTGEEALQALQSHTTSKIRELDDIFTIGSLGFRGEALASIASVSRLTLRTRLCSEETGTEIHLIGGRMESLREAGIPAGTSIEVADLFFNTPARKKFLKSDKAEYADRKVFKMRWDKGAERAVLTAQLEKGRFDLEVSRGSFPEEIYRVR